MPKAHVAILGKTIRRITRIRGGGSALPGLVVEKIDPTFTKKVLDQLPHGVVIVSGTNGKTTTTKMVVELLESQGFNVFTNRTGSNFARGVTAALLAEVNLKGDLDADIAVLELDEAHAVKFVDVIKPRYSLLLNVMRDQLDRFGEIDTTAKMLQHIAEATTSHTVLNREDPRVAAIANAKDVKASVTYFGLSEKLLSHFPADDNLRAQHATVSEEQALVTLDDYTDTHASFSLNHKKHRVSLALKGVYNTFNAAAALSIAYVIANDAHKLDEPALFKALSAIEPAFGRGETLTVGGQPVELVLVKNPSGFRLALSSFPPDSYATMIAINDNYADGRDMSWLWDVDFDSLKQESVAITAGIRAYDMALRLQYDEIAVSHVTPDLHSAVDQLISGYEQQPKRIYCTYTAMLSIRKYLNKYTSMERVL